MGCYPERIMFLHRYERKVLYPIREETVDIADAAAALAFFAFLGDCRIAADSLIPNDNQVYQTHSLFVGRDFKLDRGYASCLPLL